MRAGIAGYRAALTGLQRVVDDIGVDMYTGGLDLLDAQWPNYFLALRDIDKDLWPDAPVRPPVAVVAFTKTRKRRWYLHLPSHGVLLTASDPALPDWMEKQIGDLIEHVVTTQPYMFTNEQRWLTAVMLEVAVSPDGTGRWVEEAALFHTSSTGNWSTEGIDIPHAEPGQSE